MYLNRLTPDVQNAISNYRQSIEAVKASVLEGCAQADRAIGGASDFTNPIRNQIAAAQQTYDRLTAILESPDGTAPATVASSAPASGSGPLQPDEVRFLRNILTRLA